MNNDEIDNDIADNVTNIIASSCRKAAGSNPITTTPPKAIAMATLRTQPMRSPRKMIPRMVENGT